MFLIMFWNGENFHADKIDIKCNNFDRTLTYQLQNEELNSVIDTFVIHVVLKPVGLSCIVDTNNHLKFYIDIKFHQCMDKGTWYNKTS